MINHVQTVCGLSNPPMTRVIFTQIRFMSFQSKLPDLYLLSESTVPFNCYLLVVSLRPYSKLKCLTEYPLN